MATPAKTANVTLLDIIQINASTTHVGAAVDVSTKFGAAIGIHFGRTVATGAGAGVDIRIEASMKDSGDDQWFPKGSPFRTDFAAVSDEAATAHTTDTITVVSSTGFAAKDKVFLKHGTLANSEWNIVESTTGTTIVFQEPLTNTHTTSNLYDGAEFFYLEVDLTSVKRIRLVADGSLFTQAFVIEAKMVTWDSV